MKKPAGHKPDYKKQLENLKAEKAQSDATTAKRWAAMVNSNNQAVNDLRELMQRKAEVGKAQDLLGQSFAAIEKRLREAEVGKAQDLLGQSFAAIEKRLRERLREAAQITGSFGWFGR